jgi:hypothetical protein
MAIMSERNGRILTAELAEIAEIRRANFVGSEFVHGSDEMKSAEHGLGDSTERTK